MIPKIIWQTEEPEFKDLPLFKKDIIGTWKNLNPSWEHRYVDAKQREKYVKDYNYTLYSAYKISNCVDRSDIWRMVVTYKYGGFYADMDSICTIPLDDILKKHYNEEDIVSTSEGFQTNPGAINCSNFVAIKNSKTLKIVLDSLELRCEDVIKYNNNVPHSTPGSALIGSCFYLAVTTNKNIACFQDYYFSHSKNYKNSFNLNYQIVYDGVIANYLDIVKRYNLPIYQYI